MSIGIYKWISPSGKVYIGQSINIEKRKEWYLRGGIDKSSMPKLKLSFKKYGIEKHIFEIIEECSLDQLNEREVYWGLFYNVLEKGLNCKLGEQNCVFSEETKNKMSVAKKNKPLSVEHQLNKQKSLQEYWLQCKMNKEERRKNKQKYVQTKEHRENISKSKKGKSIHNNISKDKLRKIGKQKDMTKCYLAGIKARSKPVFQYDLNNNFIKEWFNSADAELFYNGKKGDNIRSCIRGEQKTAYGYIWKTYKTKDV